MRNFLEVCGLNETEQTIFQYLVSHGSSIASVISKRVSIKRSNVYFALEHLVKIGTVTKQKREKITYFESVSPSVCREILVNRQKNKLDEVDYATKMMEKEMFELSKSATKQINNYKIEVIESTEMLYMNLEKLLKKGGFQCIFDPNKVFLNKKVKEICINFLKNTAVTKAQVREIAVSGELTNWYRDQIQNNNHKVKEISESREILSDMFLVDGSVILLDYESEEKVGIKISHDNFYKTMMTLFDILWEKI